MADKKISELTELNSASATDIIPIVNSGETKFIEVQNLITDNIVQTITNGDTTHTPSADAVFDALALKQNSLGYTAENQANKTNTVTGNEASTSLYLSVKGYYDYLIGLVWLTATRFGTWITGLTAKTTPSDTDTIIVNDGDAKKTTWLQVKNTLKTYFDTIYLSTIANNSITNALLAQMGANTVKVNNTNATANATDLSLTTNTVLGRESGNISALPIQDIISSTAQLVAGTITVVDGRITVNSFVSGLAISSTGTSTSDIKWTASAGVMTFTSVVGTDTALFGYTIVIV